MTTKEAREGKNAAAPNNSVLSRVNELSKSRIFHKGIVVETLCDPSLREFTPSNVRKSDKDLYQIAPRNSIVCRIITDFNSESDRGDYICFPFFSSHLSVPVKVGEAVWIFKEFLLDEEISTRAYWICRIPGSIELEDANFTSPTRLIGNHSKRIDVPLTAAPIPPAARQLDFPNLNKGAGSKYENILKEGSSLLVRNNNALENLMIFATEKFKIEPVPRLTKKPGDLVLQGSNNTSISLGTDAAWDFINRPSEQNTYSIATQKEIENKSGAIDIVAGRGRFFSALQELKAKNRDLKQAYSNKNSTQPFIVENSLGFETDKNPGETQTKDLDQIDVESKLAPGIVGNLQTNPVEGDPDFLVDASRIYISERSNVDEKLGLNVIKAKGFDNKNQFNSAVSAPCIAVKSDHVRIVARKTPLETVKNKLPENFSETNGTIRIVKEGKPDEDLACIYIEADGTIQISGRQIFLGRQKDDKGNGGIKVSEDVTEAQPYIKYRELKSLWENTMDALDKFCQSLQLHTTPGYGAPSKQIVDAATNLKNNIQNLKNDIETVKSERIFGE